MSLLNDFHFHGIEHDGLDQDFVAVQIKVMRLQVAGLAGFASLRAPSSQVAPVVDAVTLNPGPGLFDHINRPLKGLTSTFEPVSANNNRSS